MLKIVTVGKSIVLVGLRTGRAQDRLDSKHCGVVLHLQARFQDGDASVLNRVCSFEIPPTEIFAGIP